MTYEELLAKIDAIDEPCLSNHNLTSILRAVVELHSPEGQPTQQCRCCKKIYPCPTIHAIEQELK